MNYHRLLFLIALLLITSVPVKCKVVYPYYYPEPLPNYIKYVSSPKAIAMGHCSINIVDERSPLTNPGGLGIFHLNKIFGFSFPGETNWVSETSARRFSMKTTIVSAGYSIRLNNTDSNNPFRIGIGVSGAQIKSTILQYLYEQYPYGSVFEYAPVEYEIYSIALGVEYIFRLGVGYSYKHLQIRPRHLWDAGIILEIPVMKLFAVSIPIKNNRHHLGFIFTPSIAYVGANPGDGAGTKMYRLGLGNLCGVTLNGAELITGRFLRENEVPSQANSIEKYHKTGFEIGLLGFFFYRWGGIKNIVTTQNTDTYGIGFSLHGLLAVLQAFGLSHFEGGVEGYLARNLDISCDYARSNDLRFSNPKRVKVSLSF